MTPFKLGPSNLVPTQSMREINTDRVQFWLNRILTGEAVEAISCAEYAGNVYIVDGHHRWVAYAKLDDPKSCPIQVLTDQQLKDKFGTHARQISLESRNVNRFDWEEIVRFPVQCLPLLQKGMGSRLCIIAGPSGAGKSTVIEQLLSDYDNFQFVISATTRARRKSETGAEYKFLSESEFHSYIEEKKFAEWQYVHGNYYGTFADEIINEKDKIGITDLDIFGAIQLKTLYPNEVSIFFIDAPNVSVLRERLINRDGWSNETIRRLSRVGLERRISALFDATIINDDIETSVDELYNSVVRQQKIVFEQRTSESVSLRIMIGDHQLKWANTTNPINPTLLVKSGEVSIDESFSLLTDIVYHQIVDDLKMTKNGQRISRDFYLAASTAKLHLKESENKKQYIREVILDGNYCDTAEQWKIFSLLK